MRASVKDLNDPVRYLRHVIRVEGEDLDVETLLHHVHDHPGGHYADEDEMTAALRYVDGKAAILEFEPEFYVTAGFAMTDFALTRGPRHATIAFDLAWHERDLIRLLAAFHPTVSIDAAVIDKRHGFDSSLTNSFRQGYPVRGSWKHVDACEISPKVLAGLEDRPWKANADFNHVPLLDVESREDKGALAYIRVRGPHEQVQAFRSDLLIGELMYTACHLDDQDEDDLVVHLRRAEGVAFLARQWSGSRPELELDLVITNPNGVRTHEQIVAGDRVRTETTVLNKDKLGELFAHRGGAQQGRAS